MPPNVVKFNESNCSPFTKIGFTPAIGVKLTGAGEVAGLPNSKAPISGVPAAIVAGRRFPA